MTELTGARPERPTSAEVHATAPVLRRCGGAPCACEQDEKTLMRDGTGGPAFAPPAVHDVLGSAGAPLDPAVRGALEPRFGRDFSRVRVHTDARAALSAEMVNARAYTVGQDIVFAAGSYTPGTTDGRRLLAHELTHVAQQDTGGPSAAPARLAVGTAGDPAEREADRVADQVTARRPAGAISSSSPLIRRQPAPAPANPLAVCFQPGRAPATAPGPDTCWAQKPENCPSFGSWLSSFDPLRTFSTADVVAGPGMFTPLGDAAAARDPRDTRAALPGETAVSTGAATPVPNRQPADRFIDHPTDVWVRTCLPPELRATAYMLPADCADTAVILWHVWLFAHHRSARFGQWVCGVNAGRADGGPGTGGVGRVTNEVYSQNVSQMLAPYADATGRPLRTFTALRDRLHPGDVLVWRHSGAGSSAPGHTQTIVEVVRAGGNVTAINVIQGNMPLDAAQATTIRGRLAGEHQPQPEVMALRRAPGRRLEMSAISGAELTDGPDPAQAGQQNPPDVWLLGAGTGLVAAGPPKTAARPATGQSQPRQVSDWATPLGAVTTPGQLVDVLEAAAHELRALVDSGGTDDAGATRIGLSAGETLWRMAVKAGGLGEQAHFRRLMELKSMVRALRDDEPTHPRHAELVRVFTLFEVAFDRAGRGMTSVRFPATARRGHRMVRILVTGFDPFFPANRDGSPAAGAWNPAAAAALALDGRPPIDAGGGLDVFVESMIFPVSNADFDRGLVEGAVGPHLGQVDAVLTVSMDPNERRPGVLKLERFAAGVRDESIATGGRERLTDVPRVSPGSSGRPLIESLGPLDALRGQATSGAVSVTTGDTVTLRFATAPEATRFAGGLSPAGRVTGTDVEVDDVAALRRVAGAATTRGPGPAQLTFTDGGRQHTATLVSGPGGNFLSNEVSFRVLRMIEALPAANRPLSFHTHTPLGLDPSAGAGRAGEVRANVIEGLTRVIRIVARQIDQRRRGSTP